MKCQLILRKFELNLGLLKKKINSLGGFIENDCLNDNLNVEIEDYRRLKQFDEVEKILFFENNKTAFTQESLRGDVLKIAGKFKGVSLKIKAYPGVKIPENAVKKKVSKLIKINKDSENHLLIELFNDNGLNYRIFSFKSGVNGRDKSEYKNISVLLEHPRLVEEVGDVLRLCLIFGLGLKVIHKSKNDFLKLLNKAKSITKGKLSNFHVDVYMDLDEIKGYKKIGFSKNADEDEKKLIDTFKDGKDKKLLLVLGNDTFGLSQEARDKCNEMIHLTPDYKKPLKASQALAYVLGVLHSNYD